MSTASIPKSAVSIATKAADAVLGGSHHQQQKMVKRFLTLPPGSLRYSSPSVLGSLDQGLSRSDSKHLDGETTDNESPRIYKTMSPGPAAGRSFATRSFKNDDDNLFDYYTASTTWGSSTRAYGTGGRSSFSEDYDEWNLHGKPTSVTQCDLGQLGTDVFDVSETRQAIFENSYDGQDGPSQVYIPDLVSELYQNPDKYYDPIVELEEDWRIAHEDYNADGVEEHYPDDVSLDY